MSLRWNIYARVKTNVYKAFLIKGKWHAHDIMLSETYIYIHVHVCTHIYTYIYVYVYGTMSPSMDTSRTRGRIKSTERWMMVRYVELHIFPSYLSGFFFQTLKINLITLTTEFAKPVDIWGPISKPPSCSVRWTGLRRCSLFNSPGSWCLEGPGGTKVLEVAPWVLGPGLWPSP